jgi:hypothetical protein
MMIQNIQDKHMSEPPLQAAKNDKNEAEYESKHYHNDLISEIHRLLTSTPDATTFIMLGTLHCVIFCDFYIEDTARLHVL